MLDTTKALIELAIELVKLETAILALKTAKAMKKKQ